MRLFKRKKQNPYLKYYKTEVIDEYSFLLEAGQGKNINGNMFAFFIDDINFLEHNIMLVSKQSSP